MEAGWGGAAVGSGLRGRNEVDAAEYLVKQGIFAGYDQQRVVGREDFCGRAERGLGGDDGLAAADGDVE